VTTRPLLPVSIDPPLPPSHPDFRFEVLGPEHNESDLEAWTTSIDHIRATAGFPLDDGWPVRGYTLEQNLDDLVRHRDHHERHLDFAWTVLDRAAPATVIGCVYLKPDPGPSGGAVARSWVQADRAHLDRPLRAHLAPWFAAAWPLPIRYP
jgi:hypothetical protein